MTNFFYLSICLIGTSPIQLLHLTDAYFRLIEEKFVLLGTVFILGSELRGTVVMDLARKFIVLVKTSLRVMNLTSKAVSFFHQINLKLIKEHKFND